MTTLKEYAKKAKDRLKNGFWEQTKKDLQQEQQVAATLGVSQVSIIEEQRRKLQRQIYDYDGFCEEEQFYNKVVEMLTSDTVISNPIMRLADQDYMAQLSPTQRQAYISKIASKYRNAVERYNRLHG